MRDGNLDERWYVDASETKEKTRGVGVHRINELNVSRDEAGREGRNLVLSRTGLKNLRVHLRWASVCISLQGLPA